MLRLARIPPRGLEQDVAALGAHFRARAAHDARDADHALGIGDRHRLPGERALDVVERDDPLAAPRAAHDHGGAAETGQIVYVHRLVELEHHVIRGVHDVVDRAHAHRLEPPPEPRGRRADACPADHGGVEPGARLDVLDRDPDAANRFARAGAAGGWHVDRFGAGNLRQAERRPVRRRELARHALVTQEVGPVGGDVHHEPRVSKREHVKQRRPGRSVGGELEDAIMLLAEAELARGAEHPLAYHAADRARLDAESLGPGHLGAEPGKRVALPHRDIGRPADDGQGFAAAIVHPGEADLGGLGIGVRADLEHPGDDERRQLGVQRLDGVAHLLRGQPDAARGVHGFEQVRDECLGRVEVAAEEVLEPAEGDVHRMCSLVRRADADPESP